MKAVSLEALVPMDLFEETFPLRVDLAYARTDNLLFGERIYRAGARLWLYKDLAAVILAAAQISWRDYGLRLVLYDGLRTIEAQEKMMRTSRVQANPNWLEEPRLLSSPGGGGHPRGMAVDLGLETETGDLIDMGAPFDFLAANSSQTGNPAHRLFAGHSEAIMRNREKLDLAMREAARFMRQEIVLLPEEWWDFRLPPEMYMQYAPLADLGLPASMRMTDMDTPAHIEDFSRSHFEDIKKRLSAQISGLR